MAITRASLKSPSALASWMQTNAVPNIFKSVTFADNTITATDDDDNKVLEIKAFTERGSGYLRAYRASNSYVSFDTLDTMPDVDNTIEVIGCDNGFIISTIVSDEGTYSWKDYHLAILVTRTNNNKVAVIFTTGESDTAIGQVMTHNIRHVAFGDSITITTQTNYAAESAAQTVLTPFATNANVGDVSYTPDAFYMPMHSAYGAGLGKFSLGGDIYITNGYWAVRDSRQGQ